MLAALALGQERREAASSVPKAHRARARPAPSAAAGGIEGAAGDPYVSTQ
jgi:hypothetical protein